MWAQPRRGGGTIATSVECGLRGGGRGQNIWHIPWWHLSECRGHYTVSPPSRATPSPSLSLSPAQCGQHSNFRAGEGAVSQRVEGEEEIELDQWVGCLSRFRPTRWLLTVRKRNRCDILQQQKLYYCGVSRSWGMKGGGGKLGQSLWCEEKLCWCVD